MRGRRGAAALSDPPGAPSRSQSARFTFTDDDLAHVLCAAELSHGSDGLVQPHPRSGCVLLDSAGAVVARTFQMGQGGVRSEVLAVREAGARADGGVAYLNLEPAHGPAVGEDAAVDALVRSRVSRVVVGILHPVAGVRGQAVAALRDAGVRVDVLGEFTSRFTSAADERAASAVAEGIARCRDANRHLLHRVATGRPFSIFKYAMTVDGKIATTSGHSAWVTGPAARQQVWAERARSDAVVVGGTTVRRDNPNLTTRRDGGHRPARIVLSRTMDLPGTEDANYGLGTGDFEEDADAGAMDAKVRVRKPRTNLWNTDEANTIVMTVAGARPEFQAELRALGVEVVEFDELTPGAVADYCAKRGYLQLFWECGGGLAGPALTDGVFHHVMAFVAPKIVGSSGGPAPSPVGETGLERMTDALALRGLGIRKHGRDVLITGYLPPASSTGALAETEGGGTNDGTDAWTEDPLEIVEAAAERAAEQRRERAGVTGVTDSGAMRFYKSWDVNGALSNFSPHPIDAPLVWVGREDDTDAKNICEWPTVEHFYQAQKFGGVDDPAALEAMEAIRAASSPEEAARIGRTLQRTNPRLIRPDWDECKERVMRDALRAKLTRHAAPRNLLLGSRAAGQCVLEDSPTDAVWGVGRDGTGGNLLGRLLMELRDAELAGWDPADEDSGGEESDEAGSVAPGLTRLLRRISDKFG